MTVNSQIHTVPPTYRPTAVRIIPALLALILLVGCAAPVTAYNPASGAMTKDAIKRMVAHEARNMGVPVPLALAVATRNPASMPGRRATKARGA